MNPVFAVLTFVALFSHAILATRWEVAPLTNKSDPAEFNISNYDPALWNVTRLPDPTRLPGDPVPDSDSPGDDDHPQFGEECRKSGDWADFCVATEAPTKCNLAVRIPSLPRPGGQEYRADGFIYDHACTRMRGWRCKQERDDSKYWSIFSDLKYTVEVQSNGNSYPRFNYADYVCKNWIVCWGWSWIIDDTKPQGRSVYIYRHDFPCDQK